MLDNDSMWPGSYKHFFVCQFFIKHQSCSNVKFKNDSMRPGADSWAPGSQSLHAETSWRWIGPCWQAWTSSFPSQSLESLSTFPSHSPTPCYSAVHKKTCLSKALTRPSSFLLLRQWMRTWVLFLTDWVRTDSGPVLNSSCSFCASSSCGNSLFGFWASDVISTLIEM